MHSKVSPVTHVVLYSVPFGRLRGEMSSAVVDGRRSRLLWPYACGSCDRDSDRVGSHIGGNPLGRPGRCATMSPFVKVAAS